MSEKEFWTKYSRAQYLHSTRNVVAAAAEAAEDEELAVFLKRDDMLANEARRKVISFDVHIFTFSWHSLAGASEILFSSDCTYHSTRLGVLIQLWTLKLMRAMITHISR